MPRTKKTTARRSKAPLHLHQLIDIKLVLEALEKHILGELEMKPTQVTAALALLKKALPDVVMPADDQGASETLCMHEKDLEDLV